MTGKTAGCVAATLMSVAAFASGCTKTQQTGDSNSFLIIDSLQAASVQKAGAGTPTFSSQLESDVCVAQTGGCGIFEDLGQATFELGLKDQGTAASPSTPTQNNFVTITRYHVDYVRSDGRNQQGVDVPFSFDAAATATVGNGQAKTSFVLVRVQAKTEAPLAALAFPGPSTVSISTIARITFFGTDQTGREVQVVGQISVNFADWADPSGSSSGSGS
jgi:hypothetical protein